jgi:hypothetical protein
MIMIDVRNAIANILDRYTLGNVVEVTLRKIVRDGGPLPFEIPAQSTPVPEATRRADPADGFLTFLSEPLFSPAR